LSVKAIAYYLPQFHEIPENDEWWGKGFTEWTNLKKAQPLFDGHEIPKPLNNNYYNLLDKETIIWQTNLAKEYGVYGFNYYHYWFKGKKLLEKPAENFLKWNDIDHKFMFMWANHDWTKSWVGGKEILIKQEYGTETDWIEHITYLIQFFKDKRYIKLGNKPVFEIYIHKNIPQFEKMVLIWNRECKKNGFDGLFLIEHGNFNTLKHDEYSSVCDAITLEEHTTALGCWYSKQSLVQMMWFRIKTKIRQYLTNTKLVFYNYDDVISHSIESMKNIDIDKMHIMQVCTGWDNSPRYRSNGYIVENATPEKFEKFLKAAFDISTSRKSDYLFIACWNEWCEGLLIEPTEQDEYRYLNAIKRVMGS